MSEEAFQKEVLQRLTAVETELKMMRRNGWFAGGTGGGVAVGLFIVARLMGLL